MLVKLLQLIKWVFEVSLLLYVAISWLAIPANRWTELLRGFVEPVLTPIRAVLTEKLPARFQILDWSPVVAWLLAELVYSLLYNLLAIFM